MVSSPEPRVDGGRTVVGLPPLPTNGPDGVAALPVFADSGDGRQLFDLGLVRIDAGTPPPAGVEDVDGSAGSAGQVAELPEEGGDADGVADAGVAVVGGLPDADDLLAVWDDEGGSSDGWSSEVVDAGTVDGLDELVEYVDPLDGDEGGADDAVVMVDVVAPPAGEVVSYPGGISIPPGEVDRVLTGFRVDTRVTGSVWSPDEQQQLVSYYSMDRILSHGYYVGAADVVVMSNEPTVFKVNGKVHRYEGFPVLSPQHVQELAQKVLSADQWSTFLQSWDFDASYRIRSGPYEGVRARVNVSFSGGEIVMVCRLNSADIPTLAQQRAPEWLMDAVQVENGGLVLFNGSTGTGKSTLMAGVVQALLQAESCSIVTLEDPVEYVHRPSAHGWPGWIMQREVGLDTRSYKQGLRAGLRQQPDYLVIGEVRDRDVFETLTQAMESGHMTLTSVHADTAALSLSRLVGLVSMDSPSVQLQQAERLSHYLRGSINQILLPRKAGVDGVGGRVAAREMLDCRVNRDVKALIRNFDMTGLSDYLMDTQATMAHDIARLCEAGLADVDKVRANQKLYNSFPLLDSLLPRT